MKICFHIFLFITIFSGCIYPQPNERDSIKKITSFNSLQKIQTKFDEFEIYRELNYMKLRIPVTSDSNTVWMWTKLVISNPDNPEFPRGDSPKDWIKPLHEQFIEASKLNPVRYILGMAQTAAVGYLVYQHIKKYGLFK